MTQVQGLLELHYEKEYEKRDEKFGDLLSNDEDIGELFKLIMELEKIGAKINLDDDDEGNEEAETNLEDLILSSTIIPPSEVIDQKQEISNKTSDDDQV